MKKILTLVIAMGMAFLGYSQTYVSEDFSTFLNDSTPPLASGWKNIDSAGTGQTWRFNDVSNRIANTQNNLIDTAYAILDSDAFGSGNNQDAHLESPDFNSSLATAVVLEFDHAHIPLGDSVLIDVYNGVSWKRVADLTATNHGGAFSFTPVHETINITNEAAGVVNARVRFNYKNNGSWAWFWIVDNVTIFQPVPDDLKALSIDSLVNGCGLSSTSDISLTFSNVGSTVVSGIPVNYQVNGGTVVTETYPGTLNPGDTATHSFTTKANLSVPGVYTITGFTSLRGDNNNVNDTTIGSSTHFAAGTITYNENFDALVPGPTSSTSFTLANNWIIENSSNHTWIVNAGGTPSTGTGPLGDASPSGSGVYLFTETSGSAVGSITTATSSCLDFGSGTRSGITLEYKYHMFGSTMGNLNVQLDSLGTWITVDQLIGQQQVAQADPWIQQSVSLNNYVSFGSTAIRFEAIGGGSYTGDISIDEIRIYEPTSADAGIISVDSLTSGCGLGSQTICVKIKNFGTASISNFPIGYSINNGTAVSETISSTILPGDTLLYCFTAIGNFSAVGTYTVNAFTSLTGDGDPTNDTSMASIVNIPILTTFPYVEGFESGNGGWTSGGANSTWALGTPANAIINSAANGTQAWVTSLAGLYNANEQSFVQGPCFDFTNLAAPQIKMNVWWNSEAGWDGAVLQSSIDGGTTWQAVGAFGNPNNWYNQANLNAAPGGNTEGWGGRNSSSNGSGGWLLAEHDLNGLGGISGVLLRIAFAGDGSIQDEGFAFDDVIVQNAPADDAKAHNFTSPSSGCGLGTADSVTFCFINLGSAAISNFPVSYALNGGTPVTENYPGTLNPGDTACHTFATTVNLSVAGTYNLVGYTSLTGDAFTLNDTTSTIVNSIPILSSFPYTEGFETGNGGWTSGGANSSWALGTPAGSVINGAANGTQAWTTNLSGQYNANEQSYVQGPCFDFTNLASPQFKMNIWWESEANWDGAVLQTSIDGGATWQAVGAFGDPNNWYNMANLNAQPGGNTEGWGGRNSSNNGSGTWLLAEHDLTGLGGTPGVLIRIAFAGDGSIQDEGFAFDDVIIQNAPGSDVGVVSFITPNNGGCAVSTADSVRVLISNFGSAASANFPVSYVLNGGTPVTETVTSTILAGTSAVYTFATTANVGTQGNTYTFDAYTGLVTDANYSNDSLFGYSVTNNATFATYPYFENFDSLTPLASGNFSNGWVGTNTGNFPWQSNSGSTGSTATGPTGDHTTGSTIYMYTEASSGTAGNSAELTSPCIDLSTHTAPSLTLSYWYHMYGADISTLFVEVDSMGTWVIVDQIVGQQQTTNADPFLISIASLDNFVSLPYIKVRFRTTYGGGYNGDVSIDDVTINANPVGIENSNIVSNEFNVFPNPSNGAFTLVLAKGLNQVNVEIRDINGKLISEEVINNNTSSKQLELSNLAKGVYFLKAFNSEFSKTEKLIIK